MIYLFAGHHLNDPGAVNGRYQENKLTIEARNQTLLYLPKDQVIIDNDTEINSKLWSRVKPGTGSVALDLHWNSAGPSATGTEVFVAENANTASVAFATELVLLASEIMGIPNRGVRRPSQSGRGQLGFFNLKAGVISLWEIGFVSNLNDINSYDRSKDKLFPEVAKLLLKYDAMYS